MRRQIWGVGLAWTVVLVAGAAPPEGERGETESEVVVVEMVDVSPTQFVFEPSEIEVAPGDRVRFVQKGQMPHNVEFKNTPDGADLGDARMGPFLTTKDQTYEIVVDGRFRAGTYEFVCTPHEALGMTGTLTVAGAAGKEGA